MINAPWAGAPRGPQDPQQRHRFPAATSPEGRWSGSRAFGDQRLFLFMDVVLLVVIVLLALVGGVAAIMQLVTGRIVALLAVVAATALAVTFVGLGRVLISIARSAHSIDLQLQAANGRP